MNRIREYIKKNPGRKLLIPFFTAGFPTIVQSSALISAATDSGADFIEIGIPFSDPLADGREIQYSSSVALDNGISLKKILKMVEKIRVQSQVPLVLMGYYNPILTYGEKKFMTDAQNAGVDGLIIPDLPIDESADYKKDADQHNLSTTFLVAPTSSTERIKRIERNCTDFVYAVTVTGVTGAGKVFDSATDNYLKGLRKILKKKFVAGFGVSSPDSARRLSRYSNGVVIGSRLVSLIRENKNNSQATKAVEKLLSQIRIAI